MWARRENVPTQAYPSTSVTVEGIYIRRETYPIIVHVVVLFRCITCAALAVGRSNNSPER